MKSIGVRLSDAQKQETAYRYGSYGAFYRQTFGKLKIRNDGVSLDSRWQELAAAEIRREIGKVKSRSLIGTTPLNSFAFSRPPSPRFHQIVIDLS